ncbi:hypothetical protein SLE2022_316730 [Rubroshorea leprosula]
MCTAHVIFFYRTSLRAVEIEIPVNAEVNASDGCGLQLPRLRGAQRCRIWSERLTDDATVLCALDDHSLVLTEPTEIFFSSLSGLID